MSMPSRGQKCVCSHARMKHKPNAGGCKLCRCGCFRAVRVKGIRKKDGMAKGKNK